MHQRVRNGIRAVEPDIFGRHYASRAVLGIFQYLVDCTTGVGIGAFEYSPYDVCGHFFYYIDRIVYVKLAYDLSKLGVGEALYQSLLLFGIHFDEQLCRGFLRQQPVEQYGVPFVKTVDKFRNILCVHIAQNLLYRPVVLFFEQFGYAIRNVLVFQYRVFFHFLMPPKNEFSGIRHGNAAAVSPPC